MRTSDKDSSYSLLVFAGPNGSGKSTISRSAEIKGLYINADEIMQQDKKITAIEAAIEAEALREYCLEKRLDFSFETVLSTDRNLNLLKRAKEAGYYIDCYYILTADPELNVFRVRTRRLNSGHDVPADKIRDRYHKSLKNIPRLITLCDRIHIVDNTCEPFIIYIHDAEGIIVISENKFWSRKQIFDLTAGL